jgi:3-hydroxy-3-methylglutaryl CoA synthase
MIGIKSFGVYLPRLRLSREMIAKEWDRDSAGGEKAVANFDEDSATLAVEAMLNCMAGRALDQVTALFFASTTPPYREKQTATLLATVADLPRSTRTVDFGDSLRAGTQALRAALDAVHSGSAKSALAAAGECRLAEPDSDLELNFGDAGAAILIGPDPIAALEPVAALCDEFLGSWRASGDQFVKEFSAAFSLKAGYTRVMGEALKAALKATGKKPSDFTKVALAAPNPRASAGVLKAAGFDSKQAVDSLYNQIGDTGSVQPFLLLAAFLEQAKPGETLLLLAYGDGADALLVTATDQVAAARPRRSISYYLETKKLLKSYGKYLRYRELYSKEENAADESSAVVLWRETRQNLALCGVRCKKCGTVQYPKQRVCFICQAKDEFDEVKMSRRGAVFTFTHDHLVETPEPPTTMTVVEFEGGGRLYCRMTDSEPDEVRVGMPVEMTLRLLHRGRGFNNYFWKCRPVRE